MRLALAALVAALPAICQAQTLQKTAQGPKLEIDMPCAKDITVAADPSLANQATITAEAAHQAEIDQMQFAGGDAIKLKLRGEFSLAGGTLFSLHGECWRPDRDTEFQPTLRIKIAVPPNFPLAIDASSATNIHIDTGGALDLDSSGSGDIDATSVTALNIGASSSGNIRVLKVSGPIHVSTSGSGDIAIAQADTKAVAVQASGSAAFKIGVGQIDQLTVESSGSSEVSLGTTVGNAAVETSGSGNVTIKRVTGHLAQNTSGSGEVTVKEK